MAKQLVVVVPAPAKHAVLTRRYTASVSVSRTTPLQVARVITTVHQVGTTAPTTVYHYG